MDNRVVQVELDVEELQNRVSQLEKILKDLSKWTGFQGGHFEIPASNEQTIDCDNPSSATSTSSDVHNKFQHTDNSNEADINPNDLGLNKGTATATLKAVADNFNEDKKHPFWKEGAFKTPGKTKFRKVQKCLECFQKFSSQRGLKIHRATKHRVPERKNVAEKSKKAGISCPHCPKILTTRQGLQYHINVHTGEKPYKCEFCSNAFRHHPNLFRHLLTCKEKFKQKSTLAHEDIIVSD